MTVVGPGLRVSDAMPARVPHLPIGQSEGIPRGPLVASGGEAIIGCGWGAPVGGMVPSSLYSPDVIPGSLPVRC